MKGKKQNLRILATVLFGLCITACGKQENTDFGAESEPIIRDAAEQEKGRKEDGTVTETMAGESGTDDTEEGTTTEDIAAKGTATETGEQEAMPLEMDGVITAYITETIEYSDEIMQTQYVDDLSLLADMKYTDGTYVYQDGKVYYRRYHEDSYEKAALWGMYYAIPETKKELVCIEADGRETELFADEGFGDIYLINDRFYMTDGKLCEEDGVVYTEKKLYSVNMQGNDRIDYGNGSIFAIDKERGIIILQMQEDGTCYYSMNYETGEKEHISFNNDDYYIDIEGYQDGWLYYTKRKKDDASVSILCAVSLEGEQREIIALTSDINEGLYSYQETMLHVNADGDRIYFIFGGYDGSAHMFQGGKLISVKTDGTDYKAVEIREDSYYLSHSNGKPLVYFPCYQYTETIFGGEYGMAVWDVEADRCFPSDFPQNILYAYDGQVGWMWRYDPAKKGALCELTLYGDGPEEKKADIYAVPDDSSKIVRVAMGLEDSITKWENEETDMIQYKDLYYADGFLYFTVEYSVYDEETSIGWRDGYRRLCSEIYRLKMGESAAQMLYSF